MSFRFLAAVSAVAILSGCSQAVDNPAQSPAYVAAALGYDAYKEGDLATAERQFETALSNEPDNPYALLGLGAVRENTGDYEGARQLYTAAQGTGIDAQANYTYITEQRLERVANIDVASLAEENLARLTVRQAALDAPDTTGFASYDGGTATVTQDVAYAEPPVYAEPEPTVVGGIAGGDYESVGSYDTYVAAAGGISEPIYSAQPSVEPSYTSSTIDTVIYSEPAYVVVESVDGIVPASFNDTPYYDTPLPYDDLPVPVQTVPLAQIAQTTYTPTSLTVLDVPAGPAGRVLGYGQAFGDPVDLVGAPQPLVRKDADVPTQTGDLIFLGDG